MSYFHKWTLYNLSSLLLFFVSLYSLSLPLCLRFFLFSSLCFSLLTVNSRFFFSTSSADSSTIPPSCRGIRVFLGIAKLAWYFPASSAPTPLPLSLSSPPPSSSHFGPDLPPQQLGSQRRSVSTSRILKQTQCPSVLQKVAWKNPRQVWRTRKQRLRLEWKDSEGEAGQLEKCFPVSRNLYGAQRF